jgi:hypothetical protein
VVLTSLPKSSPASLWLRFASFLPALQSAAKRRKAPLFVAAGPYSIESHCSHPRIRHVCLATDQNKRREDAAAKRMELSAVFVCRIGSWVRFSIRDLDALQNAVPR